MQIQDAGSFVNCSKVQTPFSLGYIMKGFSYLLWWLCPVIQGEESASFGILLASTCCPENHASATLTSLTRSQKPRLITYLIQSTFLDTGYLFSQLNIFFLEKFDTKFLHMKHTETGANTHQIFWVNLKYLLKMINLYNIMQFH